MRNNSTLLTLAIILFFSACAPQEEHPEKLEDKKTMLKAKKKEVRELTKLIDQLEAEILELEPPKEKTRMLITTMPVQRKDFKRYVDIQATVQSDDVVMASSETGGRIIQLHAEEGKNVRKGQLIAKVDMESINKQIAELEKSLELAVEVFDRQKRLWDQNIGSEIQFLQAKNNKERLEKSLETAQYQLTKANVYAPISGVVDMVFAKTGEMAGPGTPILQILNTRKVKVVADIPERYLGNIKKGEKVTVKFPALDKEEQARVSLLGSSINPGNRTFKAEVELNNSKGILKPNLLASMALNDFSKENAIVIPIDLVQQEISGKSYVLITNEGKEGLRAEKIYVETGESYGSEIIINAGLKGNEVLIVDGARTLAENDLVRVEGTKSSE